jgi:carbon-monoxide dehydrogenase large subunit
MMLPHRRHRNVSMDLNSNRSRFGSGRDVKRIEDLPLLKGQGCFTDDLPAAGHAVLVFARSPHGHARIVSVDTAPALALPGVLAVYSGADLAQAGVRPTSPSGLQRPDGSPMATPARYPLAHEVARFVGEPVVAVVAESREAALAAIDALWVTYDELPAVTDPMVAMQPGAPVLCPQAPDNVCAQTRYGDAAAAAGALAHAAHVVSLVLVNQRLAPSPLEPRSVMAEVEPGTGRLLVRISNQMPTAVREGICAALPGLSAEQVRVTVGDVGGGFGMKGGPCAEDIVVAYAARALGRPVRWQAERIEDFLSAHHGRDVQSHAELALDASGRVLALRVRSVANVGAYCTAAGAYIQLMIGPWVSTSIYDIGLVDLEFTAVLTNCTPTGAYRGAGRPEAIYIIERLMDAAARQLGMDPTALRRRNLIGPEQMPYRNALGQVYDSGHFEKILDQGLQLADWQGFETRRAASKTRGKLRGRGIATFLEWTSGLVFDEQVRVEVTGDGFIEISSATQAMGQGIQTSYAQLAVDVFGVSIDRIRILQGDTDRANGSGSAGSRSLFVGGSAVQVASTKTVDHARELAADALEAAVGDIEYGDGRLTVVGTDLGISLFDLAARQPTARITVDAQHAVQGPSWPNGCHVCEVEVDPETGHVAIVSYASVNDIGRIVSPTIVTGQIDGGAMQGIGQALCEQVVYDTDNAQLLTASLLDYALPRADTFTDFKTCFDESIPCLTNPLGSKGVGELGTIGATPAVVSAVADALAHAGLGCDADRIQMPLTAERVWQALQPVYTNRSAHR